jgi:hypothetical protein
MADVKNGKITAPASLYLKGWPRYMSRPRLVMAAWCRRCRTAHPLAWLPHWPANTVVGPAKGCRGFRAVLDDEARRELPQLLQRFANCKAGYAEWLKTAARPQRDGKRLLLGRPLTTKSKFDDDS